MCRGRGVEVLHGCTIGDTVLAQAWDAMAPFMLRPIALPPPQGPAAGVPWPWVELDDESGACVLGNVSAGAGFPACGARGAEPRGSLCCVCGASSSSDACGTGGQPSAAALDDDALDVLDARVGVPFTIYDSCMHWSTVERRRMAFYGAMGWGAMWTAAQLADVLRSGVVVGDGLASSLAIAVPPHQCAAGDGTGRACRLRVEVSEAGSSGALAAVLAHVLDELFHTFVVPPTVGGFGAPPAAAPAAAPRVASLAPLAPLRRADVATPGALAAFNNGVEYALLVYAANCDLPEHYAAGARLVVLNATRCARRQRRWQREAHPSIARRRNCVARAPRAGASYTSRATA